MKQRSHWYRFRALYAVIAVCAAPLIAAYLAYYVFPPQGRTNYGEIVTPQVAIPPLTLHGLDGRPLDLQDLRGRWVMLQVDRAACDNGCANKLWTMRQVRLTTGKDRDRVERVWLIVDDAPLTTLVLREYEGTQFVRARSDEMQRFLHPANGGQLADHIWLIDPLGNLMMRWPRDADANRMKKDLGKLLRASQIG